MSSLHDEIQNWMVKRKKHSVKASTYDRLMVSLALLDKYPLSDMEVSDMVSDDIQDYINQLVMDGYALSTIKKQYHLLTGYFEYAAYNGIVSRPIHKAVDLPTESAVKKSKKEVISYDHDEQEALRRVLMRGDHPALYAALLMMESGLRVGEALALGWQDIDFRRRAIHVRKTVVRITETRRSYVQNSAKSYTSNRIVPMSTHAYDLLQKLSKDEVDSEFVFHDRYGERLSYESLRWNIAKACDEAGVPYYGQHVFRHTFTTNCYERGCDVKKLSKLLGHSDVTITYNVYVHLYGDALEELRSVLG